MRKGFAVIFTTLFLVGCAATSGSLAHNSKPGLRARFEALADSYARRGLDRWDAAATAFSRFADMVMNGREATRSSAALYLDSKGVEEPVALAELVGDDARAVTLAAQAATATVSDQPMSAEDVALVSRVATTTHSARDILIGAAAELSPRLPPVEAQKLRHAVAGFEGEARKISDLAHLALPAA